MNKDCIIFFTRVPVEGKTKTRLQEFITKKGCADLHKKLIKKIYKSIVDTKKDYVIYYTPESDVNILKEILGEGRYFPQDEITKEEDIGSRMYGAIKHTLDTGYEKVVLIGSDIFEITTDYIIDAFECLDEDDVVISPTFDGGYCLIGTTKSEEGIFEIDEYGNSEVYKKTADKIKLHGLTVKVLEKLRDIDTREDLICAYLGVDEVRLLGAGEYNINFLYKTDEDEDRVIRINTKSQMDLRNQIEYEYKALKFLETSGVTPKAYWCDDSRELVPYGILSMEFLRGRSLVYEKDLNIAAYLLSKIHSLELDDKASDLIYSEKPFSMMYDEFLQMFSHYKSYEKKDAEVENKIEYLLKKILELGIDDEIKNPRVVNTELNSGNFIIGEGFEDSFVIDWEKPIISDPEQDVAHFLAPTTTFWKTDTILNVDDIDNFIEEYKKYSAIDKKLVYKYIIFTCLRGITWCSMAFVEYNSTERVVKNEFTFDKVRAYLDMEFLSMIDAFIEKIK